MAGYERAAWPVIGNAMSVLAEADSAAADFVGLVWLSTGRLGSLSFDAAAACVIAAGPASALPLAAVGAAGAFRFITGRSGSPSSTVVCDFAVAAGASAGGACIGPMVGLELESAGARFMVGRSGSLLLAGGGGALSADVLDDPGARLSTGRLSSSLPVITAALLAALALFAASLAACAAR